MMLYLLITFALYFRVTLALPYCAITPREISPATDLVGRGGSELNPLGSGILATAWYAGWHSTDFPLTNVSWEKYTAMIYAFATTTSDVTVISLEDSDAELLPQFVATAHQNNVSAILSVGGWSGSQYFSTAMASSDSRASFIQTILALVSQYDLDGIDIDWEYPNKQGVGCNTISANDSANFLSFLQEVRQQPAGQNITMSAAVSITPFVGADGSPMTDVSEFSQVLNWIEIMNYDIWGSWSTTGVGPNAPLNDTCAPSGDQEGSAVSAVHAWTSAGFPAKQIVLGVASYGHSFSVDQSSALVSDALVSYPAFNAAQQPTGDKWDGTAGIDQCGNATGVGGIFDFWGLVDGGFLNSDGTVASGIDYHYDNCSQTPYVYNANTQVMVSYDDATSFAAKGQFIRAQELLGFAMWEAGGDYNDILLDSISKALDIQDSC